MIISKYEKNTHKTIMLTKVFKKKKEDTTLNKVKKNLGYTLSNI